MFRAFIAIELSAELKRLISELQAELKHGIPDMVSVSWIRPEAMHLTLRFLGDIEESQVEAITDVLQVGAASLQPFTLEARGVGGFPTPARARVLWVGLSGDEEGMSALRNLQTTIEEGVVEIGCTREDRPFTPHLTLARIKDGRASGPVRRLLMNASDRKVGEFQAGSVSLIKSEPRPTGSVYTSLVEVPFGVQV
jgi:2'-5' RNA ligase